jgi:hypothetical protein
MLLSTDVPRSDPLAKGAQQEALELFIPRISRGRCRSPPFASVWITR